MSLKSCASSIALGRQMRVATTLPRLALPASTSGASRTAALPRIAKFCASEPSLASAAEVTRAPLLRSSTGNSPAVCCRQRSTLCWTGCASYLPHEFHVVDREVEAARALARVDGPGRQL